MPTPAWSPNADQQRAIATLTGFLCGACRSRHGKNRNISGENRCDSPARWHSLGCDVHTCRRAGIDPPARCSQEHVTACTCHSLAFKLFRALAPTVFAVSTAAARFPPP